MRSNVNTDSTLYPKDNGKQKCKDWWSNVTITKLEFAANVKFYPLLNTWKAYHYGKWIQQVFLKVKAKAKD